jgi:hypothetical protein
MGYTTFCSMISMGQSHLFLMWSWYEKMGLSMEVKTRWQLKLHISPMQRYQSFWRVNEGVCKPQLNGTKGKVFGPIRKSRKTNNQ